MRDKLIKWTVMAHHQWHQFIQIPHNKCATWGCHHDWHDTFCGVRYCKYHHPEYEASPFRQVLEGMP